MIKRRILPIGKDVPEWQKFSLEERKEITEYEVNLRENMESIHWGSFMFAILFLGYGLWVEWFQPYAISIIIGFPTLAFFLRWYIEGERVWFPWQETKEYLRIETLDETYRGCIDEGVPEMSLLKEMEKEEMQKYIQTGEK